MVTSDQANNGQQVPSPSGDLATLLTQLPAGGAGDDAMRLVEIYESAERIYRGATRAGIPGIGSSATTHL